MAFQPSTFQSAIQERFARTSTATEPIRIIVNAVAGSGKTKTLEWLCSFLRVNEQTSAIALCFNVSIREEMGRRLPSNMTVINFHKLGKQILDSAFKMKSKVDGYKYTNLIQDQVEQLFGDRDKDLIGRAD